ncbi:plasmid mobilization protein [Chitinophaga japonensis]|uniref:Mobilization protein MobC n=1 Tax=Chitinophaga japonensis TaxID=104662 RepID=A0A562T6V7_CHIJA|nr:plasmid mobilization relaxosome protein MobC [Chitinophaga japonensis]TWI89265.1 mobilization protein MobC [Chitinophaga japonensis]
MENTVKKKKGKGGRPAKNVKLEVRSGVRFSRTDFFIVKEKARKARMRYTVYIRHMAIHGQVTARLSQEERQDFRQLSGMGNNLNQLAKIARRDGMLSAMVLFESYREQLDGILNRIRHDQ